MKSPHNARGWIVLECTVARERKPTGKTCAKEIKQAKSYMLE